MTKEPDKKKGSEAPAEAAAPRPERPTVQPPFDPVTFAHTVVGGRPSLGPPASEETPPGSEESVPAEPGRPPMPTLTDDDILEDARLRSIKSLAPARRGTPNGLISLANARIPSNLPARNEADAAFASISGEWDEAAEEVATAPPPPMQQALIDALTRDAGGPPATKAAAAVTAVVKATTAQSAPPAPPSVQEMNDRVSLGDYTGALEVAEKLLETDPGNDAVNACAENCRTVLRQMYAARVGALDRVPVVMVARDQLRWLSIDHRAGFVLSLVDGVSSLEMILDVSGMPELDALRILSELAQQRIIAFR